MITIIADILRSTALFKVANGEDFASAPTPGMFDLKVNNPFFAPATERKITC